ncbi:hypothetical protein MJO63_11770 [Mycobacterium ulcerans]|uniref:Uncharacterized protein n=1 Tax=Mycobacterium ulcerans TaxID=1809 RepID=A0ABY3VHW1_MYCUL|nr:hypothetical protein [Mycobacterium ulcerans]UDM36324.1 hypothetical protein LH162_11770 [Mycobacterium ulcerans]ULP53597.1 hypothetical protein MJO63_11770 [Mycobacterium ulcerans]
MTIDDGVGQIDVGTGCPKAVELGFDMLVYRLVDECQSGVNAQLGGVERGRESPVGAQPTEGQDRASPLAPYFGQQPFQFADFVAAPAPAAVGAVVFDPDRRASADQMGQGAHGCATVAEGDALEGGAQLGESLMQVGVHAATGPREPRIRDLANGHLWAGRASASLDVHTSAIITDASAAAANMKPGHGSCDPTSANSSPTWLFQPLPLERI